MRQNLFRAKLAENGLSQKDVAKELGMAENTMTHKIREKSFFGVNDVNKMAEAVLFLIEHPDVKVKLAKEAYKINDRLEIKWETALKNYDKFVLRREKAKFGAGISAIGTIAAGACVSALPVVQSSANPVVLATAIGTIAVCSTIPNLVKLSKEN